MSWSFGKRLSLGKSFHRAIASLAIVSVVMPPQLLLAADQSETRQQSATPSRQAAPRDVALGAGGVLVGQVVDAKGAAAGLTPVSLRTGGKEIARVFSDVDGNFRVASLKGGVYEIASSGHQQRYRLWSPQTAPPAAKKSLTLVARGETIRGQFAPSSGNPMTRLGQMMAEHPLITAGLVGIAIAVPVAIAQDDDDDPLPPATP